MADPSTEKGQTGQERNWWRRQFVLSALGLILGAIFFACSLTPSLVPRPPLIQGALGGLALASGYAIGVAIRAAWLWLGLATPPASVRRWAVVVAIAGSAASVMLALIWSAGWQNRLRGLMQMPPIDEAGLVTVAAVAIAVFIVLLIVARLFGFTSGIFGRWLGRILPGRLSALIALAATAFLFWSIGSGVLAGSAMRMADASFAALDATFEESAPKPVDPLKTGGPGSLLAWEGLGRTGRATIAAKPDRADIEAATGRPALEPLRVYVGLNSAENPQARADLALAELIRIGAFERSNLVIITPTGTGWVPPSGQAAMEYVLGGDVASVAVQYSYLASWLALLADPEYGVETARAVFNAVYGHWTSLPRESRPRLYLYGLSLGSYNSDLSHDLHRVIGDPYQGALWSGPPFNSRTWLQATRERNPGTPAWLPKFRDGSVIRFMAADGKQQEPSAPWGTFRVLYLQYPSDAITFYDPASLWRRPDWMVPPIGADVSPDFVWIPVVTFLQLTFDMMFAITPPPGHGHTYAFADYVDAWHALTDPPGWTSEGLAKLRQLPKE
jgi:uncharacterized membrane protein